MLKKLAFIFLAGLLFFGTACEKENKMSQIGILMGSDLRMEKICGVQDGLREQGYIEEENVEFILKNAQDKPHLLPSLAAELIEAKPDIIVVSGEEEAFAVKRANRNANIPTVFVGVGIPVEIGLVESLSEPGGNLTGVDNFYVKLSGKRLELFKKLLPDIENVAIIYNQKRTPVELSIDLLEKVAAKNKVKISLFPVTTREEAVEAINAVDPEEYDGVVLLCSLLMVSVTDEFYAASMEKKLPIMGVGESQTEKGLFASYSASSYKEGIQAAKMVVKILNGKDPAEIPIEAPSTLQLVVNFDTAKKLGLEIDKAGLAYATKIIRTEDKN